MVKHLVTTPAPKLRLRRTRVQNVMFAVLIVLTASTFRLSVGSAKDIVGRAEPSNVCEREIMRASAENGVPPGVLYAVALTETGQRGSLNEFAMNVAGRSVFNTSLDTALQTYATAKRAGIALIDVGCMQINVHYHGKNFGSIIEMFDPERNVQYAAKFLRRLRVSEGSWTAAVARYHAGPGNFQGQKTYVCAVIGNMVDSGFGGWTGQSRSFCGR